MRAIPIRFSVVFWLAVLVTILVVVIGRIRGFVQIFFEHAGIPLPQRDVLTAWETGQANNQTGRTQYIPKIIHQVYHNWGDHGNDAVLPEKYNHPHESCKKVVAENPGWEMRLWNEKESRDFIEDNYPWFLKTYDGYQFNVQRVDTVRYFILLHYGGIYLDLDNGCSHDLTPLTYYPIWVPEPGRGALQNNVLGTMPHHPFWQLLTQSLMSYDHNYFFPYMIISYASGQWFEGQVWEQYHKMLPEMKEGGKDHRLHRLMMDDREGADEWVFITQEHAGGSWGNWDNYYWIWIGEHVPLFVFMVLAAIGVGLFGIFRCYRFWNRRAKGGAQYARLPRHE